MMPQGRTRAISIHAPRTGSDMAGCCDRKQWMISIHAPRTGSDLACPVLLADPAISIHAPRTGSDAPATAHCRWHPAFQSTLPARGATVFSAAMWSASPNFNPRSPHGERRNLHSILLSSVRAHFNPRSPHGERLRSTRGRVQHKRFQSTLPARGATRFGSKIRQESSISIHAPRTGSDLMPR